jgi:hypothetical protein
VVDLEESQPVLATLTWKANLSGGEDRLSWHSLRHSFASMLATDLELPATTLARLTDTPSLASFTLKRRAKG